METKLPREWFQMSDPEKLLWYVSEYKEDFSPSYESDSYFLSPGTEMSRLVAPIEEYDYAYLFLMKRTFYELLCNCTHKGVELLTKITASALLKNQPDMLDYHWTENKTAPIAYKETQGARKELQKKDIKPQKLPDLHYPM